MVKLLRRVRKQLPIAVDLGAVEPALGEFLEGVTLDSEHHRTEKLTEGLFGFPREVDENEPLPHLAVDRHQAVVGFIKSEELGLLLNERVRTVEVIAPAVIFAGELSAGTAGFLLWIIVPYELVPPMPTDVV